MNVFLTVSGGILGLIVIGTAYKLYSLSDGGISVALMLGARSVDPSSHEPDERKLLDIVEEIALASGVPVPEVFVLDHEHAINAFAAGFTSHDAVIVVTQGAMNLLGRDELQGVIAHEFSHIFNGDMRLNMYLLGWIYGLVLLSSVGRMMLVNLNGSNSSIRSPRQTGIPQIMVVGLLLTIIGSIGVFFGRLIQAAVSREREMLADASAVQYTRNPGGIENALKKIGGTIDGSRVDDPFADQVSHFFFCEASGYNFLKNWMSTHPPINERIKAIDPHFDGKYIPVIIPPKELLLTDYDKKMLEKKKFMALAGGNVIAGSGFSPPPTSFSTPTSSNSPVKAPPSTPIVSNPSPISATTDAFSSLKLQARDLVGVQALVFGLILDRDEQIAKDQIEKLRSKVNSTLFDKTISTQKILLQETPLQYFSLLQLSLQTLRKFSDPQFVSFLAIVKELIQADHRITIFTYSLYKMIKNLRGTFHLKVQFLALNPVIPDCAIVFSALVYAGHGVTDEALRAFELSSQHLGLPFHTPLSPKECGLAKVDQALTRLGSTVPLLKQKILDAAVHCVATEGQKISLQGVELLRAVAATLDCPIIALGLRNFVIDESENSQSKKLSVS